MTTQAYSSGEDPRQVLSATHEVAQRVRRSQRATWFPLLVLAATILGAIPVERFGHRAHACTGVLGAGLPSACSIYVPAALVYWPIALVAGYVAIAAFSVRRAQVRGLGTRIRPYVIVGILVAVVATAVALWADRHPAGGYNLGVIHLQGLWFMRAVSAFGAIGVALLVLAWVERNPALALFTVGYLAVVLVAPAARSGVGHASVWDFLPRFLINAAALALGGIGFALAQRPLRPPAA